MKKTITILAGGESRRMGRDKASLPLGDATLLERTATAACTVTDDALVVGRARPGEWPLANVRFVPDDLPGQGPLGGLVTALRTARYDRLLLVACDMPFLSAEALRWLAETDDRLGGEYGLCTVLGDQREPLFSVYGSASLPQAERCLAEGRRSLQGFISELGIGVVAVPPEIARALGNVNTPDEYQSLCRPGDPRLLNP